MRCGVASLIGRPNAGKSTLLNRLIGTKVAIVAGTPQTTRTRILGVKNVAGEDAGDGAVAGGSGRGQIVFVDTPGIHRPLHRMNVRMVDLAVSTITEVDVIVVVLDASVPPGAGDRFVLGLLDGVRTPVVLALNKIDRMAKPRLLPLIDHYREQRDFAAIVPLSALTGDGVSRLEAVILDELPDGEPLYPDDYLTDQPERVLVAETVREKVLHHTRAELPFSTAVVVDRFEEETARPDAEAAAEGERGGDGAARALAGPRIGGLLRLYCSIVVERPSHKPIVIGRSGARLKQIGSEARVELERFFGARVYLDLHVRVREGWRESPRALRDLGLQG
ncbi:MAG: GTPase Era [Acidobacteria bacterium]|nr:GTPase Era [Acidobacteriota bacterium]